MAKIAAILMMLISVGCGMTVGERWKVEDLERKVEAQRTEIFELKQQRARMDRLEYEVTGIRRDLRIADSEVKAKAAAEEDRILRLKYPIKPDWPVEIISAVTSRRIMVGMTRDQVLATWGPYDEEIAVPEGNRLNLRFRHKSDRSLSCPTGTWIVHLKNNGEGEAQKVDGLSNE